ncbi:MAG: DUF4957 domain-containing protein [Bacteroidaceae bacterium]|nr:DUF4957 domain-containing protein [Bacteroidaceae bacterium]
MKKTLLYTCMLGLGTLALTSCSDAMQEITEVLYGRNFSPTDLTAKNIKETSADLVWNASRGADEYFIEVYEDDSLAFTGTPIITSSEVSTSRHLETLTYDTDYSVRVYAKTSEDSKRDSKAAEVYFHTSAQQILNNIKEDNVLDRSVSLSWPEEEKAVSLIEISDMEGNLVAKHEITDAERDAASATVEGLNPETKYSVKLYYVSNGIRKERGSKTFTTIVDLNGAIVVSPDDNIQSIIKEANDGDVFALKPGKYVVKSSSDDASVTAGSIVVSKSITIKGIYPTKIPTINGRFELQDGATLEINQVKIDGEGTSGDQCFNVKGTQIGGIKVNNAEIMNYVKGVYYVNVAAKVPYITFENCLIHDIVCDGGDMFDCRKGCIEALTFSKSSIYASCAARDFIRYDDSAASFDNAPSVIKVDHCTIDDVATGGKRLLYVRYGGKNDPMSTSIIWTNNIVTNTGAVWSNQSSTPVPDFGNNNVYYGCAKLNVLDGADAGKSNLFIDEKGINADPKYKNFAIDDFTVTNEDVSKLKAGDPRWIK